MPWAESRPGEGSEPIERSRMRKAPKTTRQPTSRMTTPAARGLRRMAAITPAERLVRAWHRVPMSTSSQRPQGNVAPVARSPRPIDPGVTIGHVHLRTADIDRVRGFYVDLLGFDVVAEARDVPGWGTTGDILFVSAGGYHHHLGFNTWKSAGGGPQPDGVAGLHHVALDWAKRAAFAAVVRRLVDAGWPSARPATTARTWRCTSRIPTATTSSSRGTGRRRHGRSTPTGTSRRSSATSTSTRSWPRRARRAASAAPPRGVDRLLQRRAVALA